MEYLKLKLWTLLWFLCPMWLGEFLRRRFGIVFGAVFSGSKPVKFYLQKMRPEEFSLETWYRQDRRLKDIITRITNMPWEFGTDQRTEEDGEQ